jgi:hypothetical protein
MIGYMLEKLQIPLMDKGYVVGRETSLQILDGRQPDLFVYRETPRPPVEWNYTQALESIDLKDGFLLETPDDLQSLHVYDLESNNLVTVVEVVSPRNKSSAVTIYQYQERRNSLLLRQGVNVVEIDATRSQMRLITHPLVENFAYHAAVHLSAEPTHLFGSKFGQPLERIGLPLRAEVIAVDPQAAYTYAYQVAAITAHMLRDEHYTEKKLPFPSLFTSAQKEESLRKIQTWREELERLKPT